MTDNSYMFEILNFSKVNSKTSVDINVTSSKDIPVSFCIIRLKYLLYEFVLLEKQIVRNVAQWYYEVQLFNLLLFLTQNSLMSC